MTAAPGLHPYRFSGAGVAFVVVLHLLAFWLLLRLQVVTLPAPLAVLTVSLVPPAAVPPPPAVTPPRPKPVETRPLPAPRPAPLALAAEAPAPPVHAPPAAAPAAAATPLPAALTAPGFDAAYLDNPKPAYPPLSRRLGEQGKVVLRVLVRPDGRADEVHIHATSGSPRLDQAALDAVRRWRFVPARQGEAAVAASVLVPIAFTLKE